MKQICYFVYNGECCENSNHGIIFRAEIAELAKKNSNKSSASSAPSARKNPSKQVTSSPQEALEILIMVECFTQRSRSSQRIIVTNPLRAPRPLHEKTLQPKQHLHRIATLKHHRNRLFQYFLNSN